MRSDDRIVLGEIPGSIERHRLCAVDRGTVVRDARSLPNLSALSSPLPRLAPTRRHEPPAPGADPEPGAPDKINLERCFFIDANFSSAKWY